MNNRYYAARFEASAATVSQCPEAFREVAFAGRSNAGKSSAINTITRQRKLARTSKTPGRTQLINHFALSDGLYLVDLPGYGYAQVSKARQQQWQASMGEYLVARECLRGLILVMDIRHPLTDADWRLIELQQQGASELHLLLSKADKLSKNQAKSTVMKVRNELSAADIAATLQDFSSFDKRGLSDAHAVLDHWLFDVDLPD